MRFDHCSLDECGVARFLSLLDGPWATLIVRELLLGPVTRTAYAEIPPRVVYELTPTGQELRRVLQAMNDWALTIPDSAFDLVMTDSI